VIPSRLVASLRPSVLVALSAALGCGSSRPIPEWPEGSYCVLRARGSCPRAVNGDFLEGAIVIDTDDENGDLSSADGAAASSAGNGEHARLELCCGDFGPSSVAFSDEPFAVVAGGSTVEPLCPPDFAPGRVFIDAEDNDFGEDPDSRVEGAVGAAGRTAAGNIEMFVCESSPLSGGELPPAGYCLFAGDGNQCPRGFADGILITDDEDSGNTDALEGEVGGISQMNSTTYFPLCCT
jgi:hypothetical protein